MGAKAPSIELHGRVGPLSARRKWCFCLFSGTRRQVGSTTVVRFPCKPDVVGPLAICLLFPGGSRKRGKNVPWRSSYDCSPTPHPIVLEFLKVRFPTYFPGWLTRWNSKRNVRLCRVGDWPLGFEGLGWLHVQFMASPSYPTAGMFAQRGIAT